MTRAIYPSDVFGVTDVPSDGLADFRYLIHYCKNKPGVLSMVRLNCNGVLSMTKEVVKHRKDEKKKPALTMKERKAKKQEKKLQKKSSHSA